MRPSLPPVPKVLAQRLRAEQSPQRQFAWSLDKWLPVVADTADAEAVLQKLPPKLGREEVRVVVQEQLALERGIAAFVPVMIWGGPGGYGPFRTRAILTANRTRANWQSPVDPTVDIRLLEGARVACEDGPVEAFRLLNNSGHIKYLGGAFFTKWMSFASARVSVDAEEVAPILDKRVRDWIELHTRDTTRVKLSTTSTDDYARYLALLDAWRNGDDWFRTPVQVELAIFDLTRDRPAGHAARDES
jgi:hypothetical protein